jgi:hypothetical protein
MKVVVVQMAEVATQLGAILVIIDLYATQQRVYFGLFCTQQSC